MRRRTEEEMVRVAVMMPKTLRISLEDYCEKEGISMSLAVRKILQKHLPKPPRKPKRENV